LGQLSKTEKRRISIFYKPHEYRPPLLKPKGEGAEPYDDIRYGSLLRKSAVVSEQEQYSMKVVTVKFGEAERGWSDINQRFSGDMGFLAAPTSRQLIMVVQSPPLYREWVEMTGQNPRGADHLWPPSVWKSHVVSKLGMLKQFFES